MTPLLGILVLNHRNMEKNLLQNLLAQMLEISYVALPSYQVCSNEGLRVQNGPSPWDPGCEP